MAKTCLGTVPQEFPFSIFERVIDIDMNQAGFYGLTRRESKKRAEKYLHLLDLWHKRNHIALSHSRGMKPCLIIARAMMHKPDILILDEPTAGVDIELHRSMWDFFSKLMMKRLPLYSQRTTLRKLNICVSALRSWIKVRLLLTCVKNTY